MIEQQRRKEDNFAFDSKYKSELKNTSLNNNVNNIQSVPEEMNISNSKSTLPTTPTLPINLFHSPGEYNKMIIRCSNPHKESYLEKQMAIVRTLEFINQPFFQKEKQKRIERLKKYQEELAKQRQELNNKQTQQKLNCICCCCDNYCKDCEKIASCKMPQDKSQRHRQQFQKDIEIIKKRIVQKQKNRKIAHQMSKDSLQSQKKVEKCKNHNFHIDMLVNQTLFKQIEAKRQKMLEKLLKQERDKANHQFNQAVRKINKQRAQSAQPRRQIQKGPTKQEIREAYWNQIKDLVAQQFKKDKAQQSKLIQKQQVKKKEPSSYQTAINRYIVKKSKQALKQMKQEKEKRQIVQRMKVKKLLALAAEQAEIIKKNKSKKFKPSKETLQNAFKIFD